MNIAMENILANDYSTKIEIVEHPIDDTCHFQNDIFIKKEITASTNDAVNESTAEVQHQLDGSNIVTQFSKKFVCGCSECNIKFDSILAFQTHLNTCRSGPLKCCACNRTFEHSSDYRNHMICHFVERPYSCCICGLLFISEVELTKHNNYQHTAAIKAENKDDSNKASNVNNSETQFENCNTNKNLNMNQEVITDSEDLKLLPNIKTDLNESESLLTIKIPSKTTHQVIVYNIGFGPEQPLESQNEINKIDQLASSSQTLAEGKSLNSEDRQQNSECGKGLTTRQGLLEDDHLRNTSKRYKCTICSKTFFSRHGYLIHNRKHNNERPYECQSCWKSFRDKSTLNKHGRIHSGEKPHVCPLCEKAFNQKVVLRSHVQCMHINKKTSNTNNSFKCKLCKQKFNDSKDFCVHIIKHSDEMMLASKKASKININKKPKNDCKKTNQEDVNSEAKEIYLNENSLSKEKSFICGMCGVIFSDKKALRAHIMNDHM